MGILILDDLLGFYSTSSLEFWIFLFLGQNRLTGIDLVYNKNNRVVSTIIPFYHNRSWIKLSHINKPGGIP